MEQLIWRAHIVIKKGRFDLHKIKKDILFIWDMD